MIQPRINGNELVIEGIVQVGEDYDDICCEGYAWEVRYIHPDTHLRWHSVWGACANPNCPQEAGSPYRGISNRLVEDLALRILEIDEYEEALAEARTDYADPLN